MTPRWLIPSILLSGSLVAGAYIFWRSTSEELPSAGGDNGNVTRPIVVHEEGYVGSAACRSCHEDSYDTWHRTYHRTMTQVAEPQSIVAPFDGIELSHGQVSFSLKKDGNGYHVERRQPDDGQVDSLKVVMTTGSHHLQAYWLATGLGRQVQLFPFVFNIKEQRWLPYSAAFLQPPDQRPIEYERQMQTGGWNLVCSRCHSTHPRPRLAENGQSDTFVAEFGISCEACHGPGELHIANVEKGHTDLAIVNPPGLPADRLAQVCGNCHGMTGAKEPGDESWKYHGWTFRPGDDLEDHRSIIHQNDFFFWPDGMIRVSGREYSGLLKSPCHAHDDMTRKLTCLSCHDLHQDEADPRPAKQWANDLLKPVMDSNRGGNHNNAACTQCHAQYSEEDVLVGHTHHGPDSSGSNCYNCHMPHTSWGVMKAMRSHTVSSPSVAESLHPVKRPNACNLCHLDKSLEWTARALQQQYGHAIPELSSIERNVATGILWATKGDAGQRAIAVWNMNWEPARQVSGDDWMPPVLAELFLDPYDLVRFTAHGSLRTIKGYETLPYDFLAPPKQRDAARKAVIAVWNGKSAERKVQPRQQVLIDPDGMLMRDSLHRLIEQRDDRPVHLFE